MKRNFLTLLILGMAFIVTCQSISQLNTGFEITENGMPAGYQIFGGSGYSASLDSAVAKSGRYAGLIEYKTGADDFKAYALTLPENYEGTFITLSGFIRTENVTDGYAGLWMRIDPEIAFDNMRSRGIQGTTDWNKYEITLKLNPENTKQIIIGALLTGKGRMWVDDLNVTIDGKNIQDAGILPRITFPAESDKEFDQGSNINIDTLSKVQEENLQLLGMIWGFLKYYHPSVARGDFNWDYELFRIIPEILAARDNNTRDKTFVNWITKLGTFPESMQNISVSSDIKIKPDLEWINNGFSEELTGLLIKIRNAERKAGQQYYISLYPNVSNPIFRNEDPYPQMIYPDDGFRILSLFRYWNMIQYFFPYKNLIEEDWKNVLSEFIPGFVKAENETEYTLIVLELIGRIHDTHANIWNDNPALDRYFGVKDVPVVLSFIENKPVVSKYFNEKTDKECGLMPGDVITGVNSKPVEEFIKERLKYSPASNYPAQLRVLALNLLRTNDSSITINFIRDGQNKSAIIKATSRHEWLRPANDTCFKMLTNEIAYIDNGPLKKAYLPEIWKEIKDTKGLILDLRNYPFDFPIYELCNYLLPERTPFAKFTFGSIEIPGLFTYTETHYAGTSNNESYKGKVIILVNEGSLSSGEFHAMAYRTFPGASVLGSVTAGADGNVSAIVLPGGIRTMISGIGVYYPDGQETQRVGIVPDIECHPTIEGIKNGRDELIEKAIELIGEEYGD